MSTRTVTASMLIVGAFFYASWTLEFFLDTGIDPLRGYASELGALDRVHGKLFRSGDLATGIVVAVLGVIGLKQFSRNWLTTIGWSGVVVFAIATIVDSQVPLTCASADSVCAAREESAELPLTDTLHAVSSATTSGAAFVSVFAFLFESYRGVWPSWLRRMAAAVAVSILATTTWTLAAIALRGDAELWLGLSQRLQLTAVSCWLILISVIVVKVRGPRSDRQY